MPLSRRDFLKLSAAAAGSIPLARLGLSIPEALAVGAGAGTTLAQTLVKGALVRQGTKGAYYRLTTGPGEPFIQRTELGGASTAPIAAAISFVHFTDVHLIDAQSPARVEFLDRYDDLVCESFPLESAFRPQETLTLHALETMIRRVRQVRRGPATGRRFAFVMSTGDNIDNEQFNELRWFIDLMDGGKRVKPDSGGPLYEGVQSKLWGDEEYWHPDRLVGDKYKTQFGFPEYPELLGDAIKPFRATGLDVPWWQTFGNHDGLMQGNMPRSLPLNAIAVGPAKVIGLPPGANLCNPFPALPDAPARPVTPDPARWIVSRRDYIEEHFTTSGTPVGHGFTSRNRRDGTAYFVRDDFHGVRFVSLDTVNPGGYDDGSIGAAQFAWLEERLKEVSSTYFTAGGQEVHTDNQDRLVILFSHHGLARLNNPFVNPDPFDPGENDLPRIMADEIEALVHRFPNVLAWVNGHTHVNDVVPRRDPSNRTPGFWDINTAAHVDWNCQSRIVELAVRGDGSISIFCTMIDLDAPANPSGASGVRRLASIHRELAANDYQNGFDGGGAGGPEDRNVELTLPGPAWLRRRARARSRVQAAAV